MYFDKEKIAQLTATIEAEVKEAVAKQFSKLPQPVQKDEAIIKTFKALSAEIQSITLSETLKALQEQVHALTAELSH